MSIDEIRNVVRVDEKTLTGGQPTEDQLRVAAAEGVQAVVNLATLDPLGWNITISQSCGTTPSPAILKPSRRPWTGWLASMCLSTAPRTSA
jgi:hypothetical protein